MHIYLNMNEKTIENFAPLSIPFLGPIEFQDKETGEKLGEYPKNWQSNNNFGTDSPEDIEVTVVQINRGPQGVPGTAGTPSGVGICEGRIDIESIDTDKLDINVNEIYPHFYGKKVVKPLRKMGHVNITATTKETLIEKINKIKNTLIVNNEES